MFIPTGVFMLPDEKDNGIPVPIDAEGRPMNRGGGIMLRGHDFDEGDEEWLCVNTLFYFGQ